MFVGHTAVALAAKTRAPRTSLGVFLAAAYALDLLWPWFLLLGLERAHIDPGNTRFTPLAFDAYPWSHSLLMAIAWGVLGALLVRAFRADRKTQVLVALLVVSHWVLDFASAPPSCHASSPQSVCTSVPSSFTVDSPGRSSVPTSTTRRTAGSSSTPAARTTSWSSWGRAVTATPEKRW